MQPGLGGYPTRRPTFGVGAPPGYPPYPNAGVLGFLGADPKSLGIRLTSGRALHPNQMIHSPNDRVKVILQDDGNLVLYGDGAALWWTGVRPGVTQAVMQDDGNFVVYKPDEGSVWASDTAGHPGAYVSANDDGNLVIYWGIGGSVLWESKTSGFTYVGGPGKPLGEEIVSVAGDVVAVAQVAISFVPGVGAGINAAIAAGAALAKGEPISDAVIEAAENALPGGPVAATAFKAAIAAGKALASGQNIGEATLAATRAALPSPEAQAAFDTGLALIHGQNVQQALTNGGAALAANALSSAELPPALTGIAKSLDPETLRIATAVYNNPQLHGLAAEAIAKALHSDPATAGKALAAVSSAKANPAPALHAPKPPPKPSPLRVAKTSPLHAPTRPAAPAPPPVVVASTARPKPVPSAPGHAPYAPYPAAGALSAPPHMGGGMHPGHGGGVFHPSRAFRGGSRGPGGWWGGPWSPEVVAVDVTCRTWGNPVALPPDMANAARAALGASGGRPTTARGPDSVLYLFAYENGVMTARPCAASV